MRERALVELSKLGPENAVTAQHPDGRDLLVMLGPDGPVAYLNNCPHMDARLDGGRGQVRRKRDHLFCIHHSATFEVGTGKCIWGPCAGEGLEPVAVRVEDGWVVAG
ncbi:MAG TPA: Rieske 2Fe-2S domain-containing protein [Azospirillaceae bacterium]|nr:Rieske 2Fe-2S domain-containing protein [Azospirillaceae bacterium]